jgi:hypothetical protein
VKLRIRLSLRRDRADLLQVRSGRVPPGPAMHSRCAACFYLVPRIRLNPFYYKCADPDDPSYRPEAACTTAEQPAGKQALSPQQTVPSRAECAGGCLSALLAFIRLQVPLHRTPRPEPSVILLEDHHHQITKLSHSINAIGPAPHRGGRKSYILYSVSRPSGEPLHASVQAAHVLPTCILATCSLHPEGGLVRPSDTEC